METRFGKSASPLAISQPAASQLEALWERYCCQLEAFIRRRVASEVDAEDLLQEVFIRIHQNLCCLRDLSKLESWVYQITRNTIIEYYRRRRSTVELPETLAVEEELLEEDPEAEVAASLREMVDELPRPYREALVLTEYEGLNQRELAEKLGVSFSGAKSRVQRARQKLRDMLLTCCHFELDRRGGLIDYHKRCCCCKKSDQ